MQERVILRWANGAASVLYAAGAGTFLLYDQRPSLAWLTWIASLACAFAAVLLGMAAATGRGRFARRSGQVPATLHRTMAIMGAASGSICLVTIVIFEIMPRGLGLVFVMFGLAVLQLGQARASTGG